jgi:hypothetical protein
MLSELIAERQPALCKEDAKQVVMAENIRPPCREKAADEGSVEFGMPMQKHHGGE